MKQLLVFAMALLFVSCNKQASNQLATVQMTYEQLSKEVGRETAFLLFDRAGLTEVSNSDGLARGSRKIKAGATVSTLSDLLLEDIGGGDYELHLSTDAVLCGINNGATGETVTSISFCSTFIPSVTHPETATGILICNTSSTDNKNGWTMDSDYTIHLSNQL